MDIRDPGEYVLQLAVNWYFGATDPQNQPRPLCVGGHFDNAYRESDLMRAFVHGGEVLHIELAEEDVKETPTMPRFGNRKCTTGDTPARWLNLGISDPCKPPYCTGDRFKTVNGPDVVRYTQI